MNDAPDANSKPPFLRRRWPYFVLGFLAALPAPNLAWRAFEHVFYGGPTIAVTVIEIDPPREPFRQISRSVGYEGPEIHFANDQVYVTRPVRTARPSVDIEIGYVDQASGTIRSAKAPVTLDRSKSSCQVVIRHQAEGIDISPCMRAVPAL
jgi:hypothetical protein